MTWKLRSVGTCLVIHDFEPNIDGFHAEWVELPVPERVD
jgi:acetone carboxylase gamma subunit